MHDLRPGAGSHDAEALWAFLCAPEAELWRDKVGVRGLSEGSAKASTRLLASGGWVFKTDRARVYADAAAALAAAEAQHQLSRRLGIWHPRKGWFALWDEDWFLVSSCPRLLTLRSLRDLPARLEGWLRMYAFGSQCILQHGVELDLNPANFGWEPRAQADPGARLWYIDDETYAGTSLECIGRSLAHRMNEAIDIGAADWYGFGQRMRDYLAGCLSTEHFYGRCRELREGLEDAPMRGAAAGWRREFLAGFALLQAARRRARPRRTCVLADVHANLPALEAVLASAEELGANDYLLLGDYVGYGPDAEACIERLAALPLLGAVRGNHDQAVLTGRSEAGANANARFTRDHAREQLSPAALAWLAALPSSWRQGPVMALHGSLIDPECLYGYIYTMTFEANLLRARELGLELLFFGHSHYPVVYQLRGDSAEERVPPQSLGLHKQGPILINPGSVGQPRDRDPRAAFAIWDHDSAQIHFCRQAYAIERTIAALEAACFPPRLAQRLREAF